MGDFGATSSLDEPVSLPGQRVSPEDDDIHVLVTGFGVSIPLPLNPSPTATARTKMSIKSPTDDI